MIHHTVGAAPAPKIGPSTSTLARVGGIGGLVFVVCVVAQNLIRATSLPANGASASTIVRLYSSHWSAVGVLFALFVIALIGLVAFSGVLVDRLREAGAQWLTVIGGLGVVMIAALFPITLALDTALAVYIHRGSPSSDVVTALWIVHNAVFGALQIALGVALAGLSAAARRNGLLSARWEAAGMIGALCLAVGSAATPAVLDGNPMMAAGLVGFVLWLAFMTRTSIALLGSKAAPDQAK